MFQNYGILSGVMEPELDAVRRELAELRARVDGLAAAAAGAAGGAAGTTAEGRPEAPVPAMAGAAAQHLAPPRERMRARDVGRELDRELRDRQLSALLFMAGALQTPAGRVTSWSSETNWGAGEPKTRPEVLQDVARALAALGSEARLRLLQLLWTGEKSAAELAEAAELSTGSLYHHMRELYATRWVEMPQRNRYRLTANGRKALVSALAVTPQLL
jgi:DNA-binding transcriptional ArsR family regulator